MSSIHTRIKRSRLRRGLSQSALAEITQVSQPTVANWESGSHIPRQAALEKISEALDVTVAWLLSGSVADIATPVFDYLSRPIRHIPIYAWPVDMDFLSSESPIGYLPFATDVKNPYAIASSKTSSSEQILTLFDPGANPEAVDGDYLVGTANQVTLIASTDLAPPLIRAQILGRAMAQLTIYPE